MWKENVQKNTQLSFWWKAKSSSYELCLRGFHLCCVLPRTRSAHRLSLQHLAAVPTVNIAELVHFGSFCPQPWFLRGPNTFRWHFPRKDTRVFISIEVPSLNSWISIKISTGSVDSTSVVEWTSRFPSEPVVWVRLQWESFQNLTSTSKKN